MVIDMKKNSWIKKADYIWTYYKGWFFAALFLTGAICFLIHTFAGEEREEILSGMLINQFLDTEVTKRLEEEMLAAVQGDAQKEKVYLDTSVTLDLEAQDADTMANLGKITTYVFGRELDFMIADPETAGHFAGLNGLADVRTCLPESLLEELEEKNRLFYAEAGTEEIPCGIRLAGTEFAGRYGIKLEDPVFCIINNSKRQENAAAVIEWIFG